MHLSVTGRSRRALTERPTVNFKSHIRPRRVSHSGGMRGLRNLMPVQHQTDKGCKMSHGETLSTNLTGSSFTQVDNSDLLSLIRLFIHYYPCHCLLSSVLSAPAAAKAYYLFLHCHARQTELYRALYSGVNGSQLDCSVSKTFKN